MHRRNLLALLLAAALLAACNMNATAPIPQGDQNTIETMVQQTLDAAAVTPFISPVGPATGVATAKTPSITPTVAPTGSPTVTHTPSGEKPKLSITANSNCRSGPALSFKNVTAYTPGTELEIVGKNTENNYWQVKMPGSSETCWVWGVYVTTKGNIDSVPETTPAVPTAVAIAPGQPGALFYQYACTGSTITVNLTWKDRADTETGYRVYRGDSQVADLPANSTSYDDTVMQSPPQSLQYRVTAYNDYGESTPSQITFTACP